jgi:uncharacterized protein
MEKYCLLITVGVIGGLIAQRCHIPGGAVVGSMLGAGLIAILLPHGVTLPSPVKTTIQLVLGISLGMTFDRSFLALSPKALPLAVASTITLLLAAFAMAWLTSRLGLIDFGTALFSFSPGGMTGMAILAQNEGHKASIVAFCHTVRIFTLFVMVPIIVRLYLALHNRP